MLRITQSTNAAAAAQYFKEGLRRADYYLKGEVVEATWSGLALNKLGLTEGDVVTEKDFIALLNNRHPISGKQLTPRMNADKDRIPGWDFTFSVPKGMSLLCALSTDKNLIEIFRESVAETMKAVEEHIATRVRIGGKQSDRITSNSAYCSFLHTTTRPLSDGIPDPHYHIHSYAFNLTHDFVEDRIKAAKIRYIKDNAYFFEALFDSILTRSLVEHGYPIERTAKSWDIAGLADETLNRKFSRRTEEIETLAKELGVNDEKVKSKLGATTRNRKDKGLREEDLAKAWKSRLTPEEQRTIRRVQERKNPAPVSKVTAGQALDFAEGKGFHNNSVVDKNRILAWALKFGAGHLTLGDVNSEMKRRGFIEREIDGCLKVTTTALVAEEARIIQRVRSGLGTMPALHQGRLRFIQDFLSKEQRQAVRTLLTSNDQVIALRGYAGTGKTTLLTEFRMQLERQGIRLIALAPSAGASRGVLRDDGFRNANTIARFLIDKDLQQQARGHVILIDEAGTIGNRDLDRLMDLAGATTKIVLSGDVGQNPPVARGDTLAQLQKFAGLAVATVRQIHRQKEEGYRKAVEAMAEKDLKTAFVRLEEINAVIEVPDDKERYRRAAIEYAQCLAETGIAPLIVSPTHAEARMAVDSIREHLKEIGQLGTERKFLQYRDLKWEEAEKLRPENYQKGMMVQLHQNMPAINRGAILSVAGVDANRTVWVESPTQKRIALDLSKSDRFRVFEVGEVALATGDSVKITSGGKDLNGRRLENGKLSTVKSIANNGEITLANGLVLNPKFGHLGYGYDTSYSSQGKRAPETFVFQSARSSKAASMESFYVSISRGEQRLRIYTDSRLKLQESVGNSARRLSALEFTGLGEELFMKNGLNGQEWTQRLADSRAWRQDKMESFIKKLADERKLEPPQEKIPSYVQFLEMQKAKSTSDGKSRSKGRPDFGKGNGAKQKGMAHDPRGNQKSSVDADSAMELDSKKNSEKKQQAPKQKETEKPADKNKSEKSSLTNHVEKAVNASAKHLREVASRTKRGAEAIKEGAKHVINFGKDKTTIGKLQSNSKTKEAQIKHEATQKPSTPKPPTPAPPVIRRGK